MDAGARFDGAALMHALDAERDRAALDWSGVAVALHGQSDDLNAELGGNCMCQGALVRTVKRGTMSCQYALIVLRWLGRPPEDFLSAPGRHRGSPTLPEPGAGYRLRWDLAALHAALNGERTAQGLTWAQLADSLGCTPARLTNLRSARQADMGLVMDVTQWLGRPAADFVAPARW